MLISSKNSNASERSASGSNSQTLAHLDEEHGEVDRLAWAGREEEESGWEARRRSMVALSGDMSEGGETSGTGWYEYGPRLASVWWSLKV